MVSDKFRPGDEPRRPEAKHVEKVEKGQDVLKAEKKELKFSSHTIKQGETLSEICQQYGIPLKALYAVNQHELDPKIMEKNGKIAYGAPTYHVGDKLNIPSSADVPNAVKYFDQWAKSVIAKQRLEKPESPAALKPAGAVAEKPISRTQILDDAHLAARNAALMAKVAIETRYNQFQTLHEAQGITDKAVDLFNTAFKLGHTSSEIDRDLNTQRKLVNQMMIAAKSKDLTQFKSLYHNCTGKTYNQQEFLQSAKKPTTLAFEDGAAEYKKALDDGNRGGQLITAGLFTAASFIPGVAPVTLPIAGRLALGAGIGTVIAGTLEYMNKGDTTNVPSRMTDGAIVGVSVAGSIPIAAVTEATVLASGAGVATRYAASVRVAAGFAGGSAGGAAAGGFMDGTLTAKHDAEKGKFDPLHIAQKTGEGVVTGAVIGGPIGATGPLLKNVINIPKSVAAETAPAMESEVSAAGTAVEKPIITSKAGAPTETPRPTEVQKGAAQGGTDTPTQTQPDVSKGTATQTDTLKGTTPQTDASKSTAPQTDVSKGGAPGQHDLSKGTGSETTKWDKGSTHDVSKDAAQPQPDISKGTTQSDAWKKGSTHEMPTREKPTADVPPDSTKLPRITSNHPEWQKELDQIYANPMAKGINKLEKRGDWEGVEYKSKLGNRTIQQMYNTKDGSKMSIEHYNNGRGEVKEVTTINAEGNQVTNKWNLRQNADGKEQWIPQSDKWESQLAAIRRDPTVGNLKEVPTPNNPYRVTYKQNGKDVEVVMRNADGARYKTETFVDHRGATNQKITTTDGQGKEVTNWMKKDAQGEWKSVTNTASEPISSSPVEKAPPAKPSEARSDAMETEGNWTPEKPSAQYTAEIRDRAMQIMRDGNNWVKDRLKYIQQSKEIPMNGNWRAVRYTDENGAVRTDAFNPANGNQHSIREYRVGNKLFREEQLAVHKGGLTLWQKLEGKKPLTTGLEEPGTVPEIEWKTVETKRMTALPNGKTRIDVSSPETDNRPVTTEQ